MYIMQIIKIDLNKTAEKQIDLIVDYLKRGQVITYPTDTIYGLGCDARDAIAIEKIKKIKNQKDNKPMLVLVSDYEMLKKYCVVDVEQEKYLQKILWPRGINPPHPPLQGGQNQAVARRPVTVILENRKNLPDELTGGLDSLAVRLPKNEFLIKIISKAGFPIVSTSLNITGQPPLKNARKLEQYFDELPDLAVDAGECKRTKPSRLVDLRDMENIKIIRR